MNLRGTGIYLVSVLCLKKLTICPTLGKQVQKAVNKVKKKLTKDKKTSLLVFSGSLLMFMQVSTYHLNKSYIKKISVCLKLLECENVAEFRPFTVAVLICFTNLDLGTLRPSAFSKHFMAAPTAVSSW